jgi:isoleucyl-tRNA synthetase
LRFLLGALDGFSTDEAVNVLDPEIRSAMPELERYVMHRMTRLQEQLTQHRHNYDYGKYMQAIHNFCAIELSALYFDVRKDRLYCDRPDMLERRICRSVLAHVFEALETWLAPVLAFTTFEAWTMRPKGYFNDAEQDNIHLMDFVTLDASWKDEALEQKWSKLLSLRKVALGAIEKARNNKDIGGSLEADLEVYVPSEWRDLVAEQDLAELCIVSQYSVSIDPAPQEAFTLNDVSGVGVVVQTALGEKCQRCWKILPEVGSHPVYKNVSLRDADAVEAFLKQQKERAA